MNARDYALLAAGWDAAVAAMTYEDGTPVELAANVNPYTALRDAPHATGGANGAGVAVVDAGDATGAEKGA